MKTRARRRGAVFFPSVTRISHEKKQKIVFSGGYFDPNYIAILVNIARAVRRKTVKVYHQNRFQNGFDESHPVLWVIDGIDFLMMPVKVRKYKYEIELKLLKTEKIDEKEWRDAKAGTTKKELC